MAGRVEAIGFILIVELPGPGNACPTSSENLKEVTNMHRKDSWKP